MLAEPNGEFLRHIAADVLVILIEATITGQNPYSDLFLHLLIVSQVHDLREKSNNHAIKKSRFYARLLSKKVLRSFLEMTLEPSWKFR
jgi:uncharacterized protein YwgA